MSEYLDNDDEASEFGRVNSGLTRGLKRCSSMVRDYRTRLIAANSNEPDLMLGHDSGADRSEEDERTG